MKAVIMAVGFGTHLRPLAVHASRPCVPVAGVPITERLVPLGRRDASTDLPGRPVQPAAITPDALDGAGSAVCMRCSTLAGTRRGPAGRGCGRRTP